MKYLKPYNESVRDHLKPKPKDEILDILRYRRLSPIDKLDKGSQYGIMELVKQGIEEGADKPHLLNFAIVFSSEGGHVDILRHVLKYDGVNPSEFGNGPLLSAIYNSRLDIVKELLKDSRIDLTINHDGINSAVKKAIKNGNVDLVNVLMNDERIVDILKKNTVKLYNKKIRNLKESIISQLTPKPIDEILKVLDKMDKKQKFEYIDRYNLWKLLPKEMVRYLLKNYTKDNKLTMIQIHNIDQAYTDEELIDIYDFKKFPDSFGEKFGLLKFGIRLKRIGIVKHALDIGADPNEKHVIIDRKNFHQYNEDYIETNKILEYASFMGDVDIVRLLLEHGAEIGNSLDIAKKRGYTDIVKLLEKW